MASRPACGRGGVAGRGWRVDLLDENLSRIVWALADRSRDVASHVSWRVADRDFAGINRYGEGVDRVIKGSGG